MAHASPQDSDLYPLPPPPSLLRRRSSQGSVLDGTEPDYVPPMTRQNSLTELKDADVTSLGALLKGVVQVFVNQVIPSNNQPWTKRPPQFMTGTGFIVDLRLRIIATNAHCVEFAKTILLRKTGDAEKHEAHMLAINHQCDLAFLTVPDDAFWVGAVPIEIGEMPRMQQKVDVVGYPIGGDTVSITSGVVSRIDWQPYSQSGGEKYLCVQVDASINPGNSGGPALSNGKLVGVAFQGMRMANNIGYIIPISIFKCMMSNFNECAETAGIDLNATHVDSAMVWPKSKAPDVPLVMVRQFARFSPKCQSAENPFIRRSVSLPTTESGIIVRAVPKLSNLHGVFLKNDILVAVDGVNVENDGRICFPPLQPISFQHIVTSKLVGDPVHYTIYRDGERKEITCVAENPKRRIPLISKSPFVSFAMFAGFVFLPVFNEGGTDVTDMYSSRMEKKNIEHLHESDQCVVLTSVLPHSIGIGYDETGMYMPLYKVNDQEIRNIFDVAMAISSTEGEMITFEFVTDECIVLPYKKGIEATLQIQEDYGMASVVSADILDVLIKAGKEYLGSRENCHS